VAGCAWLVSNPVSAVAKKAYDFAVPERIQEARADGRERKRLANEVAAGRMTFEEAGCEYRGGAGHCAELQPPIHHEHDPNEAPPKAHLEGGNPRR
jgi:hypothetical protein